MSRFVASAGEQFGTVLRTRRAGEFLVRLSSYPAGLRMPVHHHPLAYFSYVVRGRLEERRGRTLSEFAAGSVHFHAAQESHEGRVGPAGLSVLSIVPQGELCRSAAHASARPHAALPGLAARCDRAFRDDDETSALTLEAGALELLAALLRAPSTERHVRPPAWIAVVREHLTRHHARGVSLAELAALAGVHPVHLVRAFRRQACRRTRTDARSAGIRAEVAPLRAPTLTTGQRAQRVKDAAARSFLISVFPNAPLPLRRKTMSWLRLWGSCALLLALAAAGARAAAPDDAALVRTIDARLRPLVARGDLSGQLLVLRRGRVLLERSFGYANVELGAAVTPETRFNIASVTKPMTSVVAIQLIQEHRLGLHDPLSKWLPGFPRGDSILVVHLLGHRSGIPHEIVPDSLMTRPFAPAELARRAMLLPLDFPPDSRESYSSGGFEVLARLLELAGGKDYAALLAERVFRPLGMTHSSHADGRVLLPGRAQAYVPGAAAIENAPLQDLSGIAGAGSVWSTARDLHRFVEAVVTGKLGEGARQSFVRSGRLDFNGRTNGFKAWARWDSTSGVEAIFVGNLATGAPDALRGDIPRLARGEELAPLVFPALRRGPAPEEELRRWEGVYQIEHGPRLELRVRDGALYSNDWVMLPTADGALFSPRDYGIVRAVAGAGARPERLDWRQGTEIYPAKRVAD